MRIEAAAPMLKMPGDDKPMEVKNLEPKKAADIHGWIKIINNSDLTINLSEEFRLRSGYFLTITDKEGKILFQEHIDMNETYLFDIRDGEAQLNKKNNIVDTEKKTPQTKTDILRSERRLSKMKQKG